MPSIIFEGKIGSERSPCNVMLLQLSGVQPRPTTHLIDAAGTSPVQMSGLGVGPVTKARTPTSASLVKGMT